MTRRRRIAALLDRLSLWVFGETARAWQPLTQDQIDALIDAAETPPVGAS